MSRRPLHDRETAPLGPGGSLSEAIASGATFRVTVRIETDVLERVLEIVEKSTVS